MRLGREFPHRNELTNKGRAKRLWELTLFALSLVDNFLNVTPIDDGEGGLMNSQVSPFRWLWYLLNVRLRIRVLVPIRG